MRSDTNKLTLLPCCSSVASSRLEQLACVIGGAFASVLVAESLINP